MSARVCNPVSLTEIAKLRSPVVIRRQMSAGSSLARVKRDLFGPVDKQESKKFIDRQLAAQSAALSQKWGFDFAAGKPLLNHDQYKWERVPPTSAPACFVEMVTLTRTAHLVPQSSTSAEDLLDQRAERENGSLYRHHQSSPIIGSSPASVSGSDSDSDCSFGSAVRTYPLALQSEAIASVTTASTTTGKSPSSAGATINRAKLQPRITDFLKERKRLSTGSPKPTAAKKARQMLMPSSSASSSNMSLASPSNAAAQPQQQQDH
uniref:Putative dacapo n=1 Tax=Aedes albopictus TaxID=7160 RepID=A0A023EP05_AEDAL